VTRRMSAGATPALREPTPEPYVVPSPGSAPPPARRRRGVFGRFLALVFLFLLIATTVAAVVIVGSGGSNSHHYERVVRDTVNDQVDGLRNLIDSGQR
jgi:hypothetical protein